MSANDNQRIASAPRRRFRFWPRLNHPGMLFTFLLVVLISAVIGLGGLFVHHVPSGQMLVVIAKTGEPLPYGQVLGQEGEKGIREQVLGEGWHFIPPYFYATERKPNILVPGARWTANGYEPAKVGIVKSLGGKPLPPGQYLAEKGQQGIWRDVLLPGTYRLNPYGYEVTLVDMVEIKPGYVGVMRRKLGDDGATEFATKPSEKGIIRDKVLQPGLFAINTEEYEVIPCEIGIYQTSYHYTTDPKDNTALVFDASDSNRIQLDCTIEWELKPEFWPQWLSKFRSMERIESTVIKPNVKNISRNKGQDYGAKDFLDGAMRERFQTGFAQQLSEACGEDNVIIRHAFIRNIIIPDAFLKPKRDEQLAREKAVTQAEQTETAKTQNEVAAAERTIAFEVAKVAAATQRLVAAIEREAENLAIVTDAQLEKLKDQYSAEISILDAQRAELLGKAEADGKMLVNTARSSLYKLKLEQFNNDSDAFLRYTMAQSFTPQMRLRLFQSGPGTFWTNMGDKNMNLFLPAPGRGGQQ